MASRDEWLHETDLPLLRLLQQARWQPVRGLGLDGVLAERFGASGSRSVYLTLYSEGPSPRRLDLSIDEAVLGRGFSAVSDKMNAAESLTIDRGRFSVSLLPGQLRVLEFQSR